MHLLLLRYLRFTEITAYVQLRFKLFILQHKNLRKPVASEQYVNLTELSRTNTCTIQQKCCEIQHFSYSKIQILYLQSLKCHHKFKSVKTLIWDYLRNFFFCCYLPNIMVQWFVAQILCIIYSNKVSMMNKLTQTI